MPAVRSTDDTSVRSTDDTLAAPTEDIEKEQSIEDNDLENDLENNNNTSQHDEITGVSEADNTPSNVTAGSNDMPVTTSPLTNDSSTDVHEQQDYPRRPGLRKLTRKSPTAVDETSTTTYKR